MAIAAAFIDVPIDVHIACTSTYPYAWLELPDARLVERDEVPRISRGVPQATARQNSDSPTAQEPTTDYS